MNQLELCQKADKILCTLYDERNGDGSAYLDWSEIVSGGPGLIWEEKVREFLENTPDVEVTEADLLFLNEFVYEGCFSNHVDDNWQETVYVSRHKETGHLIGVRSIYSSYGDGTPYEEADGLTHCFQVRPIPSWEYGAHEPNTKTEEVKNDEN